MDRTIIDYVKQSGHRIVSPIWGGERPFVPMCMGYLSVAQALGFELRRVSEHLEIVREGQLTTREELGALVRRKYVDDRYFQWEIDYLGQMRSWNLYTFCGGGCFGPLTAASCILGAENMLRMLVKDPELVEGLVKYITGFLCDLAEREKEAGQDFFWIAEPVASLLSPGRFWRFCGQYLKRIFEAANSPGFLHVCGKTTKHTALLEETGAQVISIDSCTDIGTCIRTVGEDTIIMGNVSTDTLRFGTAGEVEKEVQDILDACRGFPNFILSTGCSIMEGTPEENMQVMFDMAC